MTYEGLLQALAIMPTGTCLKRGELVSLRTNSLAQGPKANQPLGRCVLCLTNQGPKSLTCEFHILTIILRSQGSEQLEMGPRMNHLVEWAVPHFGGAPFVGNKPEESTRMNAGATACHGLCVHKGHPKS